MSGIVGTHISVGSRVFHMSSIVDRVNDFRGTRPAQAISIVLFLGVGGYNFIFEEAVFARALGLVFIAFGLLGVYNFIVGESIVHSISSRL